MTFAIPALVVCDLDGTLVDSIPDLAQAIDAMMMQLGLPPRGEEKVRHWVGGGAERLVKRALVNEMTGEPDTTLLQQALPLFKQHYAACNGQRAVLYSGVREGLAWLQEQGCILACITNKPEQFTRPLLRMLEIDPIFRLVISGDTLPTKKPDPLPLLHAANHFQIVPSKALMIGDSINDVQAARAAGFSIICVSYGYNHGQDIRTAEPDAVIDTLAELPALLN